LLVELRNSRTKTHYLHRGFGSAQLSRRLSVRHRAEDPQFGGFPCSEQSAGFERCNLQGDSLVSHFVMRTAEPSGHFVVVHPAEQPDFSRGPAPGTRHSSDAAGLSFGHQLLDRPLKAPGQD
jgi:hypothetical protein